MEYARQRASKRSNWRFNPTATRSETGMVYQGEKLSRLVELGEQLDSLLEFAYKDKKFRPGAHRERVAPHTRTDEGVRAALKLNDLRRRRGHSPGPWTRSGEGPLPKEYVRVRVNKGPVEVTPIHGSAKGYRKKKSLMKSLTKRHGKAAVVAALGGAALGGAGYLAGRREMA